MDHNESLVTRVRENTLSSAIAALLLSYYGFTVLAEPTGTGMFERAGLLFYHTLRVGGVMMAVIAVLSIIGVGVTLLFDAIVSVGIGVLFAVTGLAMWADGGTGLNPLLQVVFGAMFVSAGVRNGRHYSALRGEARQSQQLENTTAETVQSPMTSPPTGESSTASLAGHLREHRASQSTEPPPAVTTSESTPKTFGRSLNDFEGPMAVEESPRPVFDDYARAADEPTAQDVPLPPTPEPTTSSELAGIGETPSNADAPSGATVDEVADGASGGEVSNDASTDDSSDEDGGFLAAFGRQDPPSTP